jgi:large exoprotein involved in heme utilization and adhesion
MPFDETEREMKVLAVFRELLGAPQLGPEENFFDAGGSSLLAARLATRLRTGGVLDVPTAVIFDAPTARALARYAGNAAGTHGASANAVTSAAAERGARQRAAFARLRPASMRDEDAR